MKYWGRQDGDKRVLPGDYNLALHPLTPHPLKPETLECAQKGSLRYHYEGTRFIHVLARSVLVRFPDPLGKWPQPRQGTRVGRRRSRSGGLSPNFLSSRCAGMQQSWRTTSRPRMPGLGSRLPQWNVHVQAYRQHVPISKIYTTPLWPLTIW